MNSEVKILLEHRQTSDGNEDMELSEVFQKTLDYCKRFSKFKNKETIVNVRTTLTTKRLHKFEIAALANLCPETADEAKGYKFKILKFLLLLSHNYYCFIVYYKMTILSTDSLARRAFS